MNQQIANEDEYSGPSVVPGEGLDDGAFIRLLFGIGAALFLSFAAVAAASIAALLIFKRQLLNRLKQRLAGD